MTILDCQELAEEIQGKFADVRCEYNPVTNHFDIQRNELVPIRVPFWYWESLEGIAEAVSRFA
jgi:hypothetical protein